jgi:hypothetical protein
MPRRFIIQFIDHKPDPGCIRPILAGKQKAAPFGGIDSHTALRIGLIHFFLFAYQNIKVHAFSDIQANSPGAEGPAFLGHKMRQ